MNDFDGGGFDWNGNGHRDIGDGCFTTIGAIAIIMAFLYLLGSCS